jgi:hypothetical protein
MRLLATRACGCKHTCNACDFSTCTASRLPCLHCPGAMRVAPLGFAYRNAPVDALKAALLQTLIPTHHLHPWAIEGALAQALAVAHLSKLQPPTEGPSQQQGAGTGTTQSSAAQGQACNAVQTGAVQPGAVQTGAVPAGALEFLKVLQQLLRGHSDVMCARLNAMEQGLDKVSPTG